MVLPGHLAGGYLATYGILALSSSTAGFSSFSPTELSVLFIIGTLAGELPDLDLAWFYLENRNHKHSKVHSHREHITHTPIFWLGISALIAIFGFIFNSSFISFVGLLILAGTWTHFILDSIESGIRWLWPFSNKSFCLIKTKIEGPKPNGTVGGFNYYWKYVKSEYLTSVTFYAETFITMIAILVFLFA
ncbi:MAG: metal-dependent hydrolase [Candidatus Paceibacterota bacterium]|jgi:hypothetical protein